jgi:TonB-linked SusC/RagA family outer membrane protein
MINSLSGKVSGVNIRSSASDPGSTVFINIRGQRSLSGDNQPLIVLDGIPVNNSVNNTTSRTGNSSGQVVDYGNPISDINPDDVASISVLKGAAAAALYGSRAANGVILITSKSGITQKKGIGVSLNTSIAFDEAWQFPKFQNIFGSGTREGTDEVISSASWGPRLNTGKKYVQWDSPLDENGNPIPVDWVSYPNRVKDFFQTGSTIITNVAVSGANGQGNFRLSLTAMDNEGILPNTDLKRNNINLTAGYKLHQKLNVNTNVTYTNNKSDNRPTFNRESAVNIVYTMPANINIKKLRDYWTPGLEDIQQSSPVPGGNNNPYFVLYENLNGYNRDRLTGNIQFNWDINSSLSIMGRSGIDYYGETRESRSAFSSVHFPKGAYSLSSSFFKEQNTDFLITYKNDLSENWSVSVSAGANRMDRSGNTGTLATNRLVNPGIYSISNAAAGTVQNLSSTNRWQKRINSIYGMGQAGYKNYVFLDLTARNDWSSALPAENNSYFYPSVSLSVLLSDILRLQPSGKISYIKLRGNLSQVGQDVDPYSLFNVVNLTSWDNENIANQQTDLKNNKLKPEISTSAEVGADLRFFTGRLGLDFTYYNTYIKNQVMNISTTAASGYGSKVINAGEIQNKGIEITLRGTPVAGEFTWDISANFTRNRNKILELTESVEEINIGGGEGINYYARVGNELGDMYARTWKRVPDGPYAGEPWLAENGSYQRENEYIKIGNYNPDFMVGFTTTFNYKGFSLSALIDWRQGGNFYSYVERNLISDGRTEATNFGRDEASGGLSWVDANGNHRNDGMKLYGYIQQPDGSFALSNFVTDPESYYGEYYWDYNERSTFDATYVKLREISIDYSFARKSLGKLPVSNLNVGIWGRNLYSWTAADLGFDPESSMSFTQGQITPGIGGWSLPYTRTYGFKIGLNF